MWTLKYLINLFCQNCLRFCDIFSHLDASKLDATWDQFVSRLMSQVFFSIFLGHKQLNDKDDNDDNDDHDDHDDKESPLVRQL